MMVANLTLLKPKGSGFCQLNYKKNVITLRGASLQFGKMLLFPVIIAKEIQKCIYTVKEIFEYMLDI